MLNKVATSSETIADSLEATATSIPKPPPSTQVPLKMNQATQKTIVVTHTKDLWSFISEFVLIGGSLAALAYMLRQIMKQQDPDGNQKQVAEHLKTKLITTMKKYGRNVNMFATNPYEDSLLDMIVLPEQIDVGFNDIGGLDFIKRDLTETVLVPLVCPHLAGTSRLCQPPLGVLFYGCPGTGKSMVAKAVAHESHATFFNVDMSRLMSKWYGDSQKYISALFMLARKMAPSIIWIDEIDALFSQRSQNDHSADIYNKALFLSLWDGLANDIDGINRNQLNGNNNHIRYSQVMILGATNRPQEVDEAFLRRMSRQYEFEMPDEKTRKLILQILLHTEQYDKDVNIDVIAKKTSQYSGSDLKEVCKYAATMPLREYLRKNVYSSSNTNQDSNFNSLFYDNNTARSSSSSTPKQQAEGYNFDNNNNHTDGINTQISNQCSLVFNDLLNNRMNNNKKFFQKSNNNQNENNTKLRPINMTDFETALKHVQSTTKAHLNYKQRFNSLSSLSNFSLSNLNNNYNGNYTYSRFTKSNDVFSMNEEELENNTKNNGKSNNNGNNNNNNNNHNDNDDNSFE